MPHLPAVKRPTSIVVFTVALCAAFGLATSDARAKNVTVRSGATVNIDYIASYDGETCYSLLGKIWIEKQARHGRISLVQVRHKLTAGLCKGHTIKVVVVRYRSSGRYRGDDTASVTYIAPPGTYHPRQATMQRSTSYRINVK